MVKATNLDTLAMDGLNITQNQISNNGYGIYNSGDSQNISQNQVSNNLGMGINSIGQTVSITLNTVSSNGLNGIVIGDTYFRPGGRASAVTVGQNQVFGNGVSGIMTVNTGIQALITKNSTYNNGKLGIDLIPQAASVTYGVTANDGTQNATQANRQMDYPVFTSVALVGSNLMIQGYVGSAAGQTVFANASIEIFKANNDGNQNGEVIIGDGQSKPHGEGQTYLTNIVTDANGNFSVTIPLSGLTTRDSITATDAANNTSEFSADYPVVLGIPNISLLKSCPSPADCTIAPQIPDTDLTYNIKFSNGGFAGATNLIIVDKIPDYTDFKLGTATANVETTGLTMSIEYSSDYDALNPSAATWTYSPVSGGGANIG